MFKSQMLPDPRIIHNQIQKIINAFKNLTQMELIKVRWEEINRLQASGSNLAI